MLPPPQPDWALFFDIDGTLIEHADHPEGVSIPNDLPQRLAAAQTALGGAVALISGRTIAWMDSHFEPVRLPASGQHGAEIRLAPDAPVVPIPMPKWRAPLEERLKTELASWPGVYIEHKPLSLAVHFRAVPEFGDAIMERVTQVGLSMGPDVEFLRGRFVIEVRQSGRDKGTAVAELMRTAIFAGRKPLFFGDDVTDEDGFREARRLGGFAVAVGPRATQQADYRLAAPIEVRAFLNRVPKLLEQAAS
ncbi:trehalose-phosphatase [Ancylobacter sp. 6x-1]|uniref:Trehalose 6-phosphate phosphatase n=1 Tax=Ancylobacter crimeensis TaxID=2579147 RepID=A0ABT0DAH6_9HYPH|nr:trehalose-phosphatase [Ancylobacter crimeensis]MCK0196787.1 trehalose-phosphatase [Ancylobacter crimeensis]